MLFKKTDANLQNIRVAFFHVYDIVMDEKVILVMREPDIEKSYSRVQLVGQIQILSLGKAEGAVRAARIMGSRNIQCRHWSVIGNLAHP
jgi:hypothetical protein